MTQRTEPPFRADHVGSFLRPESLMTAVRDFRDGRIDADAYRAAQDGAIREIIALQESVGLRSATDGEFRRRGWSAACRRRSMPGTRNGTVSFSTLQIIARFWNGSAICPSIATCRSGCESTN